MTALDRFDRVFVDVLADVAQPAYPDYIESALDIATRKRQRPAWAFPERWLPMSSITRAAPFAPGLPLRRLALLAIVALLAAAIVVVAAGALRRPAPPFGPAGNGQIAFEIDGDIFVRNPGDGTTKPIVSGDPFAVYPIFSRDGFHLAYFVLDPATKGTATELATLYVANADGTSARALLGPLDFRDAIWAPDGRELAVLTGAGRARELSILGLDGSRRVIDLQGVVTDNWIDWRPPDGREIVFMGGDRGSVGIFKVPSSGGQVVRVTDRTVAINLGGIRAGLTPDGKTLVYENLGPAEIDIRTVDLDTGVLRVWGQRLPVPEGGPGNSPMHEGAPFLSSDGTRIAFGRYWDDDGEQINHQYWAATLAGDGADAIPVGPKLRSQGGVQPWFVMLSPDGSQIVVHRLETEETWLTDWNDQARRQVDWGLFYNGDWQRLPR